MSATESRAQAGARSVGTVRSSGGLFEWVGDLNGNATEGDSVPIDVIADGQQSITNLDQVSQVNRRQFLGGALLGSAALLAGLPAAAEDVGTCDRVAGLDRLSVTFALHEGRVLRYMVVRL